LLDGDNLQRLSFFLHIFSVQMLTSIPWKVVNAGLRLLARSREMPKGRGYPHYRQRPERTDRLDTSLDALSGPSRTRAGRADWLIDAEAGL
jgi:hypothetical protein